MIQYAFNSWLNGYKKMFCYSGRERRSAFGCFLIIQFILFIILGMICTRIFPQIPGFNDTISDTIAVIYCLISFMTILPYNIRRLHDAGLSGWLCLFYLGFAAIVIIVSIFLPPTTGDNQYGPSPKKTKNLIVI